MNTRNHIHIENVPSRDKITNEHLRQLHDNIKNTMARSLLEGDVFDISSGVQYVLNIIFDDINRIRINIFDLIEYGESLNRNIDVIHKQFQRLMSPIETTTNIGVVQQIKTYIDVWNTFVNDCNTTD